MTGSGKELKGSLKEGVGKLVGNENSRPRATPRRSRAGPVVVPGRCRRK